MSYAWDFGGTGEFTTSTGSNPTARFVFTTGTHHINLRVTNSSGQSATSGLTLQVPGASPTTINPLTGTQGGCSSEVTLGTVVLYASCVVANHDGSGYTISGTVLTFNGMTLEPRGGGTGTWTLSASASGDFLSGTPVNVVMPNTPIGSVVLGTLDLTHSPLDVTHAANTAILAGRGPRGRAARCGAQPRHPPGHLRGRAPVRARRLQPELLPAGGRRTPHVRSFQAGSRWRDRSASTSTPTPSCTST